MSEYNPFAHEVDFQYPHVEMEEVVKNPHKYIIPECLPACKALWEKNIPTFMTSDYDDLDVYYVLLASSLSDQNIKVFETQKSSNPNNYFFSDFRKTWGIRVDNSEKISKEEATQQLLSLTSLFLIQDTQMYLSIEDFLDNYKRTGGKGRVDQYGHIYFDENPELANTTFEQALEATGKKLYMSHKKDEFITMNYI